MDNTSMLSRKTKEESVGLSSKTRYMVETALMIAIVLIMGNTVLGTIPTPFLKVSIVTVPVALAAMLIGPAAGIICGIVFGLNSFAGALTGASLSWTGQLPSAQPETFPSFPAALASLCLLTASSS